MNGGAKTWYFPDGYLPKKDGGSVEAHEAVMMMNVQSISAEVKLDFYFENKPPVKDIPVTIGAERVISLHLDQPGDIGGIEIPPTTQYALRIRSSTPIIAMFGRLDTTQANMSYYTVQGLSEN